MDFRKVRVTIEIEYDADRHMHQTDPHESDPRKWDWNYMIQDHDGKFDVGVYNISQPNFEDVTEEVLKNAVWT